MSLYGYGAPLGGPLGRRSSAKNENTGNMAFYVAALIKVELYPIYGPEVCLNLVK